MPAEARGSTYKLKSGKWGVRWYEGDTRRFKSGFQSKSQARVLPRRRPATAARPARAGARADVRRALRQVPHSPRRGGDCEHDRDARRSARPAAERRRRRALPRPRAPRRRDRRVAGQLPERFRYAVMSSFRQVCAAGVRWGVMASNPAVLVGSNPQPAVVERDVLEPVQVDALAAEMSTSYGAAVVVGAWCYLRPGELLGLERRDVGDGVLHVNGSKTRRSIRTVPLPLKAAEALSMLPARIDSRLLFAGPSGGVYDVHNWRAREFGMGPATPPGCEDGDAVHAQTLGISWALAAGVPASGTLRGSASARPLSSCSARTRTCSRVAPTRHGSGSTRSPPRARTRPPIPFRRLAGMTAEPARFTPVRRENPLERGFLLGADDGDRTRDPWLGKPMLCQLSYVRARRNVTEAAQTGHTISGTLEAPAKATRPPLLASLASRRTVVPARGPYSGRPVRPAAAAARRRVPWRSWPLVSSRA